MLQIFLHFIFISVFCLIWGFPLVFHSNSRNLHPNAIQLGECINCFFAGLAILSVVSSWISILLPLQFWLLPILSIPVIAFNIFQIKKQNIKIVFSSFANSLQFSEKLFLCTCIFLFLFLSSGRPVLEDQDLYHLQTIKWINEYGTVPGLSNLYLRYGFYSNWFHLISLFSIPFKHQNFGYLNLTICIWMLLFLFRQYKIFSTDQQNPISKHIAVFTFFVLIYMLFEWDLFRVSSSSTTYDFIITCFALICISYVLIKIVNPRHSSSPDYFIPLLICTAPFFKLTGCLLFFLLIIYIIKSGVRKKEIIFSFIAIIIASAPFFYKNYIQTGYILFPYQFCDFFTPDWKTPEPMVSNFSKYISLCNHYINQSYPSDAWVDNSKFSYFKNWFLFLTKLDQILVLLSILGLPTALICLKKTYKEHYKIVITIQLLSYLMLLVWLYLSPDARFAFGLLLFTALFPLSGLFIFLMKNWTFQLGFIVCGIMSIIYISHKWKNEYNSAYILSPHSINPPANKVINVNRQQYYIPDIINNNWNTRCYNTALPCIYQLNPYLEQRTEDIQDGFRMKSMPDENFVRDYRY